jgi:hypothetical protein
MRAGLLQEAVSGLAATAGNFPGARRPGPEKLWQGGDCVKTKTLLFTLALLIALPLVAKQKDSGRPLIVTAVGSETTERLYTTTTAGSEDTRCRVNFDGDSANCHTTITPSREYTNAIYFLYQTVTAEEDGQTIQYKLFRTARWRWSSTASLTDGEQYEATVQGKHMYITGSKDGNQGRSITLKYTIRDIRPAP